MYRILLVFLTMSLFSCNGPSAKGEVAVANIESLVTVSEPESQIDSSRLIDLQYFKQSNDADYSIVRRSVAADRERLQSSNPSKLEMQTAFEKALLHRIIPFWEGTGWSFEGHTSKPQVGSIACGYFVSTTLNHAGLKVNRYKLAQQSPINEAKSLALDLEVIEIVGSSVIENIKAIEEKVPDGIHFIGFDQSHVGYILKHEGGLYLIHSNYVEIRGVEIERIEASSVFPYYHQFYIVPLSTNKYFLKAWLTGEEINVLTE